MSAQWSASRWARFLVIVLIALPGIGLRTEFPSAMDLPSGHPRPNSACDSEKPVILTTTSPITHLTADGQSLYWLTRGNPGAVMKMSKSNGKLQVLAELGLGSEPYGILVDNKTVFWVEQTWQPDNSYTLKKVDQHGKKITKLWQAPGWMGYLNTYRHNLYWLDYEANAVFLMSKKGGEPKALVSGLEGLGNLAIVNGQIILGGYEGLGILERPGQKPRKGITSEQLLQDLHIGLRDEWSRYAAGPVIAEYNGEFIFVFSVANNLGWGSCTDNADHIVALPESGGTPHILLTVSGSLGWGSLIDADLIAPFLYTVGMCQGGQMTNLNTGKTSAMDIGWGTSALAVDKKHIYWANREGLECMRRPTE